MKTLFLNARPLLLGLLLVSACTTKNDDPQPAGNPSGPSGTVGLEITDAPIDDATVKGVFVTVAAVKIDGKAFPGFTGKKTINILALQNGGVESLGLSRLETGTYANLTLVLDGATDASGSAPGCYVLTDNNQKLALTGASQLEVTASRPITVSENGRTNLVVDFDLRKAIRDTNGNASGGYAFETDLNAATRVVVKESTGAIVGRATGATQNSRKVVAFCYRKGQFNRDAEVASQFRGAVTSTVVTPNGDYKLAFLEEGDYDVCFASYQTSCTGAAQFQGLLQLSGLLNLGSVSVRSNAEAKLDVSIAGLLGL